jgi:hypothetical protein
MEQASSVMHRSLHLRVFTKACAGSDQDFHPLLKFGMPIALKDSFEQFSLSRAPFQPVFR